MVFVLDSSVEVDLGACAAAGEGVGADLFDFLSVGGFVDVEVCCRG